MSRTVSDKPNNDAWAKMSNITYSASTAKKMTIFLKYALYRLGIH